MSELDLDALFAIAEAGPTLDKVVAAVPAPVARRLEKLQEDVGLEIDHEMTGAPLTGPGEGPDSARLRARYEPVTRERLGVFHECLAVLPAGDLKNDVAEIAGKLPLPETPAAPAATLKQK
jgi:hypothetical protein